MNRISDAPSLPTELGMAPATDLPPIDRTWPGLASASARIGVVLDQDALARFGRYRDLLQARNAQFNLTAIRDPDEIERRLMLDALAMLPVIDATLTDAASPPPSALRLIDIGSGAGFPGLPLKIARPTLDVTLVDATSKKVGFLREVIADLQLDSVRAVHARAEELGRDRAYRERFDVATARAVAALPTLLELVVPMLDVGGLAFLPKGATIDDEVRAGKSAARKLGAELLPTMVSPAGDTRIVVARKAMLTPGAYPRRPGIPGQSPLSKGS